MLFTRTTTGVVDTFSRVFVGTFLAFVAASLVGPISGMAIAHVNTAWASAAFGYSLGEYRQHIGTEKAANVAVTLIPTDQSKKRMSTVIHCVFTAGLLITCFLARMVWLVFIPNYDDVCYLVLELSIVIWWILYFCLLIVSQLLLQGTVISADRMLPVIAWHIGSYLFCFFMSQVVWIYFFALQMMMLAAIFGYILSIYCRYLELVAGRSTAVEKDAIDARRKVYCC